MADVSVHVSGVSCEPLVFPTLETCADAPAASVASGQSRRVELLIGRLLFEARSLAMHHVRQSRSRPTELPITYCDECQHAELGGKLEHANSCRVGIVLSTLAEICASDEANEPTPRRRREDWAPEHSQGWAFGEPWKTFWTDHLASANEVTLFNAEQYQLALLCGAPAEAYEHAERIRACVNFCAGIATEVLEHQLPLASAERKRWHEVKHLRDALPWLPVLPTEADDSAVLR